MRTRKPFLIFWPQYFDAKRSRSDGRRLPKNLAIDKINTKEIAKAAKNLGYHAEIEGNFKYPKAWYEDPGRVVIDTKGKQKSKVILEIAKEIRKIRGKG
ncbi:MAG: signal recognition particle protein Srp19 [Promethearchaeota archaeon]|nr:MAG: signal recognition particle protein Srp19 [Candidatus Lokiarchaeota archaeon]